MGGECDCVMIYVGKHKGMYSIWGMLERRKYTEVYNCVGTTILGLSMGMLLVVSILYVTGWDE